MAQHFQDKDNQVHTSQGAENTGHTSTYTFSAAEHDALTEAWTGNNYIAYHHWGGSLVGGGWSSRYLKMHESGVSVGWLSRSSSTTMSNGTNTFQINMNGGSNQMILSVTGGTTNWNYRKATRTIHTIG